jgi:hypothetical protein
MSAFPWLMMISSLRIFERGQKAKRPSLKYNDSLHSVFRQVDKCGLDLWRGLAVV